MPEYFKMPCAPGFELCGRHYDYLVIRHTENQLPERGFFVATHPDWGGATKLCHMGKNGATGEIVPLFYDRGDSYPPDAEVFGVVKYACTDLRRWEGPEEEEPT